MSRVFVDTSAIFALLVPTDKAHRTAVKVFEHLRFREEILVTTSYVLVETYALLGNRVGREAVEVFREEFAPLLDVVWVDRELHERGLDTMMTKARGVSLVDAVSFVCIRGEKVDEVSDDAYAEGFFGLFVNRDKTENLTIVVDKVSYWTDPQEK